MSKDSAPEGEAVIADVAPPGTSLPSSSGRPVVPHREVVRDPMTVAPDAGDGNSEDAPASSEKQAAPARHTNLRLEPIDSGVAASDAPATDSPSKATATDDLDEIADEAEKVQSKDAAAVAAKEALEHEAEIDTLIASKQYALPISSTHAPKTGRNIVLVLLAVLVLAGLGYYYYAFVL